MKIELGQLNDENSVVDITKLLSAYALRIGAVKESTWESLIQAVIARPSKRFIWDRPERPVFFAHTKGQRLDFTQPASTAMQGRFLRGAAALVGLMKRPWTHDVRRGSAADIYNSQKQSVNAERTRRSLGHNMSSLSAGITDSYTGRMKNDSWAARLDDAATTLADPFGVQLAPTSFVKRKIESKAIDKYCTTHNLDKGKPAARKQACRALEEAQYDQWVSHQHSLMNDSQSRDKSLDAAPASSNNVSLDAAPKRAPLKDITNIQQPPPAIDSKDDAEHSDDELTQPTVHQMSRALGIESTFTDDRSSADVVESMSQEYLSLMASEDPLEQAGVLTSHTNQFINYLSTINLVSTSNEALPASAETGHSRDEPTRFLFACRKTGCNRTFRTGKRRDQHGVNCKGAVLDDLSAEEAHFPAEDQKGRKRKRDEVPSINVVHVDDGFPKLCPDIEQCGYKKEIATAFLLRRHQQSYHDDNWPAETTCNVPGCPQPRDRYYVSRRLFASHLHDYHLLDIEKANEYVAKIISVSYKAPRGATAAFISTMCLFPECESEAEFASYDYYTLHLKKAHKQTTEQYAQYKPTIETVRLHPRPDVSKIDVTLPVEREFVKGPCGYPDCSQHNINYSSKKLSARHLYVSHGVSESDAAKYFTGPEIAPFYGTTCLHPACSSKAKFYFEESTYAGHLKRVHKVRAAEISSFQLWYKLKYTDTIGTSPSSASTLSLAAASSTKLVPTQSPQLPDSTLDPSLWDI